LLLTAEALDASRVVLRNLDYKVEAPPCTFKNTRLTLYRLTKFVGDDFLTVDILVGYEDRYRKIIESALAEQTAFGVVKVATRDDLIWLKRLRNSQRDIADIQKLEQ
jgi:hypothetical protein